MQRGANLTVDFKICAITLVSEQTIPNIIFLKWCLQQYTEAAIDIICLSTEKMESAEKHKSVCIKKALGAAIEQFQHFTTIKIDEFNMTYIQNKLKAILDNGIRYHHTIVDITGGTKIMALAVYAYFEQKEHTRIVYQPIEKNAIAELHPVDTIYPIFIPIHLHEYFTAYGIEAQFHNECQKPWEENLSAVNTIEKYFITCQKLIQLQNTKSFKRKIEKRPMDIRSLDQKYLTAGNKDIITQQESSSITINEFCEIAEAFGFNSAEFTYGNLRYLTGGWFEEYVYQTIQKNKNLRDDKISLNIKIKIQNTDNELDVVFIDDWNRLNIIECKSFIDEKEQADILNNTIYKIQALRSNFGLSACCFLYTMSTITKTSILNRAKNFKITIVDRTKLLKE